MKKLLFAVFSVFLSITGIAPVQVEAEYNAAREITKEVTASEDPMAAYAEWAETTIASTRLRNKFNVSYDLVGNHSYMFTYSDDYFLYQENNVPCGELARVSSALSQVAKENPSSIQQTFRSMGFEDIHCFNYARPYTFVDFDFVAFSIATKTITLNDEQYQLYCIPIRGTTLSLEWLSNFNLGEGGTHEGFYLAEQEVINKINEVAAQDTSGLKKLFWFTGHSRGAAVANLAATEMTGNGDKVIAYTFACPAVSESVSETGNIFNYNKGGDLVPMLPLESWGYKRNGHTIQFGSEVTDILCSRYFEEFNKTYTGIEDAYALEVMMHTLVPDKVDFLDVVNQFIIKSLCGMVFSKGKPNFSFEEVIDFITQILEDEDAIKNVLKVDSLAEFLSEMAKTCGPIVKLTSKIPKIGDKLSFVAAIAEAVAENIQDDVVIYGKMPAVAELREFLGTLYDESKDLSGEEFLEWKQEHYVGEQAEKIEEINREIPAPIIVTEPEDFLSLSDAINIQALKLKGLIAKACLVIKAIHDSMPDGTNIIEFVCGIGQNHNGGNYVLMTNAMYFGYKGRAGVSSDTLPDLGSIRAIDSLCFADNKLLKTVTIPESIYYVGNGAFSGNTSLTSVKLPVDCQYYHADTYSFTHGVHLNNAFSNCPSINKITFTKGRTGVYPGTYELFIDENGIVSQPFGLFHGNSIFRFVKDSIETVVFEDGIVFIGKDAFYGNNAVWNTDQFNCPKLKNVIFPLSVKYIGESAFRESGIEEIDFSTVEYLGNAVAAFCKNLTTASTSAAGIIPEAAYKNCESLTTVPLAKEIKPYAFQNSSITEATIMDDAILGEKCFVDCTNLKKVRIPVDIDYTVNWVSAFTGCNNIETIIYTPGSTGIQVPVVVYEGTPGNYEKALLTGTAGDSLKTVIFEDGVTEIVKNSCGNAKMEELILPNSVSSIGASAFENCVNLERVNIPAGFDYTVNANVFKNDTNITQVTYTKVNTETRKRKSSGVTEPSRLIQKIAEDHLETVIYEAGITEIPDNAFYSDTYHNHLKNVSLPSSLQYIGQEAFYDQNLEGIVLPESLSSLGSKAFGGQASTLNIYSQNMQAPSALENLFENCSDGINLVINEGAEGYDVLPWSQAAQSIMESREVIGIEIQSDDLVLERGTREKLSVIVSPWYAEDKEVHWSSSDEAVAQVDDYGKVTAVKSGSATITATASNGLTDTVNVTVITSVNKVTVSPKTVTVELNETTQLTATVEPADADDTTVTWTSDNEEVAAVGENGLVTGTGVGQAVITATSVNGKTATATVTVAVSAQSIEIQQSKPVVLVSESIQLTAVILPENTTDKTISWNSTNNEVATVTSEGTVTGVAEGTAVISARTHNGITAEVTVTVTQGLNNIKMSHICSFDNDLTLGYLVPVDAVNGFENINIEVKKKVYSGTGNDYTWRTMTLSEHTTETYNDTAYYRFNYKNIAAKQMGDELQAVLHATKDGVEYTSPEDTYSVKQYAMNRLAASDNSDFKTMMVDLLNYGTAAQNYFGYNTENPANADITADQQLIGTQTDPDLVNTKQMIPLENATASFYGNKVIFGSNIELKYYMQFKEGQNTENVKLKLSYTTVKGFEKEEEIPFSEFGYDSEYESFTANLATIAAKDMGQEVTAVICDGDTPISETMIYGIETYAYNRLNMSTDVVFKTLIKEMMKYSRSAQVYFRHKQ